jgi:tetratricopeptide (TPR) repeat protein
LIAGIKLFAQPNGNLLDHSGALDDGLESALKSKNGLAISVVVTTKQFMYALAGDHDSALEMVDNRVKCLSKMQGSIHESLSIYLDGLSAFGAARRPEHAHQRRKLIKRARTAIRFLKALAKQNPACCLSKYILLEAENAALAKKYSLAEDKYEHAIALAKKYENIDELSFCNRVAGEHFVIDRNNKERGVEYFRAACKIFEESEGWAAVSLMKKKIAALEDRS